MKILLINGSPKGKTSNSLRLAYSFIEGVRQEAEKKEEVTLDELHVASLRIGACRGCFVCWKNTPGVCCMKDDMHMVIEKELQADLIVWSFPLYYFNVPGMLKNLIDRQLPMNLPFMSENTSGYGSGSHESRYEMKGKRHVLISTCGFYSAAGNYDSVRQMFNHFLGKDNYASIFCGQGELFKIKELSAKTDEYLGFVRTAGQEFARGKISEESQEKLHRLLFPKETFEKMADASWGINKSTGEKKTQDLIFTEQMALLYNKDSYDGKDRVLEMHYTDLNTSYQILLGKDGSKVYTDGSLTATTRIDTPFEVWAAISKGELDGSEALGKQMYSVNGDFSLMMNWDKFFGASTSAQADSKGRGTAQSATEESNGKNALRRPSMTTMLIPWITFWVAVAINPVIGAIISLGVCALVPLIMGKHRFVIWDKLSLALVAGLSAAANITGKGDMITNAGYIVFGLLWLISCLVKEPLCATYVKYDYKGDYAMKNPLFMKTNYIIAGCWGCLYILTAVWTYFLRAAGLGNWLFIINNAVPILMGAFTVWFVKWYPAKLARGKKR